MIVNILIPTDFSPASWKATQLGLELSRHNGGAKLSLLHVYPVSSSKNKVLPSEPMLESVKDRMNKLAKGLTNDPDIIKNVVLPGNVEQTLIKFIKENDFDLVIVGVNSNGSTNEIGSHTLSMIEKCGSPILIVPNSENTNPAPNGNGALAS